MNIYVYTGTSIFILLLFIATIYFINKSKKQNKKIDSTKLVETIFSIFSKDNIVDVESEVSRVKITVKDIEVINLDRLEEITEGVFISGNTMKIIFKNADSDLAEEIKNKL